MQTVTSKDGTKIAYETSGQGPALVIVDGALCYRNSGPSRSFAKQLSQFFTVYIYDRRGRGDSGDTLPYATEREVEDIEAIIDAAGGSAYVFAQSSGSVFALEAASVLGDKIKKVAVYEAPLIVDDTRSALGDAYVADLKELVAADRRSDAVAFFMRAVGAPGFVITIMKLLPNWSKLKAVAHTLPYDLGTMAPYQIGKPLPAGQWSGITVPTFVGVGGKSPAWMKHGQEALVGVLPNAVLHELPGQTHMLRASAIMPLLVNFFKD